MLDILACKLWVVIEEQRLDVKVKTFSFYRSLVFF